MDTLLKDMKIFVRFLNLFESSNVSDGLIHINKYDTSACLGEGKLFGTSVCNI